LALIRTTIRMQECLPVWDRAGGE